MAGNALETRRLARRRQRAHRSPSGWRLHLQLLRLPRAQRRSSLLRDRRWRGRRRTGKPAAVRLQRLQQCRSRQREHHRGERLPGAQHRGRRRRQDAHVPVRRQVGRHLERRARHMRSSRLSIRERVLRRPTSSRSTRPRFRRPGTPTRSSWLSTAASSVRSCSSASPIGRRTYEGSGIFYDNVIVSSVGGAPPAVCGDGAVEGSEQCDDGNLVNGDGCDDMCNLEAVPGVISINGDFETGDKTGWTEFLNDGTFTVSGTEYQRRLVLR